MKVLLSSTQLDVLLNTGRLELLPAYVDKGVTYYSHNCMFPDAIAELNCPEPFVVHNKPFIEAGSWLTAVHTRLLPDCTSFHPMFVYPDLETMMAHDMRDIVNAVHRAMSRPVVPAAGEGDLHALTESFLQGCTLQELPTFREVFNSFIALNPKFIRMAWETNDIPNAHKFKTLCLRLPDTGLGVCEAAAQHIFKKWTLYT